MQPMTYKRNLSILLAFSALIKSALGLGCTTVDSFDDLAAVIGIASTDGVVLLCPFSVEHNGDSSSGLVLNKNRMKLICAKSDPDDKCVINGTARHFDIIADGVTILGFDFIGSNNGAIHILDEMDVAGTSIISCNFEDNDRTAGDNGFGGAIKLSRDVSENTFIFGTSFRDNKAASGGAIFGTGVTVMSSSFTNNIATEGEGGAVNIGIGLIGDSTFSFNLANENGPTVYSNSEVCSIGQNYACHGYDYLEKTCDGVYKDDGSCSEFENACDYPTVSPTLSMVPSRKPTDVPSATPTDFPSLRPSSSPTRMPSSSPTVSPSRKPSAHPTQLPTISPTALPTEIPSASPTQSPSKSPSARPSLSPTSAPSSSPTHTPTARPSGNPTSPPSSFPSGNPTASPTDNPSVLPSKAPSSYPSTSPSGNPSASPSSTPTKIPSASPTINPTVTHSTEPSNSFLPTNLPSYTPTVSLQPSVYPTKSPSSGPSVSSEPTVICNMSSDKRGQLITEMILGLNHVDDESDLETVYGDILKWIIEEDAFYICPQSAGFQQRYAAAAISKKLFADESLSSEHECTWPGFKCNSSWEVIEFRHDGLSGKLPEEISLLEEVESIVMQKGTLIDEIPSSVFGVQTLKQVDLDKNTMGGIISTDVESSVERLDINFNNFSGSIDFLTSFPNLVEAQLDNNNFHGTIPASLGQLTNLHILTLHGNEITGYMPDSVCELREKHNLKYLMADCDGPNPKVVCECCTKCNPYRK